MGFIENRAREVRHDNEEEDGWMKREGGKEDDLFLPSTTVFLGLYLC